MISDLNLDRRRFKDYSTYAGNTIDIRSVPSSVRRNDQTEFSFVYLTAGYKSHVRINQGISDSDDGFWINFVI